MKLVDLLGHLDVVRCAGDPNRELRSVTRDSRQAGPRDVFVAIEGAAFDGHTAVRALTGVGAVVVSKPVEAPPGVPCVVVRDGRLALAQVAAALEGHPARRVPVVGITGTNGKTTITTLFQQLVQAGGGVAGRIGTTGVQVGERVLPATLTTPEAPVLQRWLSVMADEGAKVVAMEVSSIGLVQRRVDALPFSLAVFTNLGRDHLDFHGTMEAYQACKARLFTDLLRPAGGPPRALMCRDDPRWKEMGAPPDQWTYGFAPGADVQIVKLELHPEGMKLRLKIPSGTMDVEAPLIGRHNAQNLAGAIGCCLILGMGADEVVKACPLVVGAAGRLEPVPNERGLTVVVDYAHTPGALEAAIASMRAAVAGAVWVVFGCGGDRDRGKRRFMGEAALSGDHVVLTSDNPRSEAPRRIAEDVLVAAGSSRIVVLLDRQEAIAFALSSAQRGDGVLIAGKGHETTQEIDGIKRPFDDRLVARALLEAQ